MRIAVCVKQEYDVSGSFSLTEATKSADMYGLVCIANPADVAALSLVRQTFGQDVATVTALTVGPETTERTLRTCLSLGADNAVRIWDDTLKEDTLNTLVVARLLAAAILNQGFDLIVCGSAGLSGGSGFVGPALADYLGCGQICSVSRLALEQPGALTAHRRLEHGDREIVRGKLPLVITIDAGTADAAYASFPQMLAAERAEITALNLAHIGLKPADGRISAGGKFVQYIPPRPRTKKSAGPDTSNMTAAQKMQMLSGGGGKQKSAFVEGSPQKAAKEMIRFLEEHDLLTK
jgi:electron transfer flavoprotein beta subunit